MKYLLLFALLAIAYFVWRNNRLADRAQRPPPPGTPAQPQQMVSCAECSVHLPRNDAMTGADGRFYCSHEHRLRHDQRG